MIAAKAIATKAKKTASPSAVASQNMESMRRKDLDLAYRISEEKRLDPDNYEGWRKLYLTVARDARTVAQSSYFNGFVIGCIVLAGVLVGLQTYPSLAKSAFLDGIDLFILFVFLLESFLKIMAEGLSPWMYFVGREWRWNNFDFVIVVLCLPIWGDAFGGGNVAILRMLRLMRVMKLVKKVPQLYMIVMGLIGGMKSIAYILLLLQLVFYLYGIAGMYAFRTNDPWHFGNLFITMITLFRMATLEDWTDVMYINYFGCDQYDAGIYSRNHEDAIHSTYCNVTLLWGGMTQDEIETQRNINKFLSATYFVTFIVISALVMLSLFVGAITMSMTSSMDQMKQIKAENERKRLLEKAKKKALMESSMSVENVSVDEPSSEQMDRDKMRSVLMKAWDDVDLTSMLSRRSSVDFGQKKTFRSIYKEVAASCRILVEDSRFSLFITYVILIAGIVVGLQTDENVVASIGPMLNALDTCILVVFTSEVILKLVAQNMTPWFYFHSAWNSFDFVIVVGSFLPGSGSMLTMLRLLRLLRVLKLVKSLPQLQVIVSALLKGLGSIGYIGLIMFIVFYVFAILGIILFRKNDPWHFESLHFAMLTLFRCATMEDWTDVMYINMYGCANYGYSSYIQQGYTCDSNPQGILSAIYFTIFVIIGALILITLFIGVVTTSMEEATQEMKSEQEIMERVKEIQIREDVDDQTIKLYLEVFNMLDLDKGGTIEEEELRIGLSTIGKHPSSFELQTMMKEVDEDESGQIDLAEFVEFMINLKKKETCKPKEHPPKEQEVTSNDDNDEKKDKTECDDKNQNAKPVNLVEPFSPPSSFDDLSCIVDPIARPNNLLLNQKNEYVVSPGAKKRIKPIAVSHSNSCKITPVENFD